MLGRGVRWHTRGPVLAPELQLAVFTRAGWPAALLVLLFDGMACLISMWWCGAISWPARWLENCGDLIGKWLVARGKWRPLIGRWLEGDLSRPKYFLPHWTGRSTEFWTGA